MGLEEVFGNAEDEVNLEKILAELLKKDDIEMKTDIENPQAVSLAMTTADYLESRNMNKTAKLMRQMVNYTLLYNVSKGRKSRTEIVEAFKAMYMLEQKKKRKLLGSDEDLI